MAQVRNCVCNLILQNLASFIGFAGVDERAVNSVTFKFKKKKENTIFYNNNLIERQNEIIIGYNTYLYHCSFVDPYCHKNKYEQQKISSTVEK